MYFANISISEKYNYLEEKFRKAYKWLAETDISALGVGSYPIDGDVVVANVQEYTTYPASEASFETHEKFFDIQYMASGREMFGVCKRAEGEGAHRGERPDFLPGAGVLRKRAAGGRRLDRGGPGGRPQTPLRGRSALPGEKSGCEGGGLRETA